TGGCQQESPSIYESGQATFPLPAGISTRTLPSGITAQARIYQNDEEIAVAPIKISGTLATAQFPGLAPGNYVVTLQFVQTSSSQVLATARKSVTVGTGASQLGFSSNDYTYPDDDKDKYSNLDEINEETNPSDAQDKPQPPRVFITSIKGSAKLSTWSEADSKTGVDAGDAICQARANAAGYSTQFKAWLSDTHDDAYCRILGLSGKKGSATCDPALLGNRVVGPWVRIDGETVFPFDNPGVSDDWDTMLVPICVDENGLNRCSDEIYAWTGTDSAGRYLKDNGTCLGWTSSSTNERGGYGSGNSTVGGWTATWRETCGATDAVARLYCFETTERAQSLPDYRVAGSKTIFLSSISGTGDLNSWEGAGDLAGIEAGDAVCQRLANDNKLPNPERYKAWLSDDTTSIRDRITSNGPWSRPDGVLVAKDKAQLLSGILHTSIAVTEEREYEWERVWTGTLPDGTSAAGLNCSNWRHDNSDTEFGKRGSTTSTRREWTDADHWEKVSCNLKARIICLED
ncbi:MAG TPA: DUF1554 domain-containing protein, partial [Gammaproteobacteria bacterium]|nr:DUF1554 domain-containing protein [Gammaproteobacteria bacterium]